MHSLQRSKINRTRNTDAWAIWDPFFVAAQKQIEARVLTNAVGIVNRYQYFLSAREYAEKKPEVPAIAIEELGKVGQKRLVRPQ